MGGTTLSYSARQRMHNTERYVQRGAETTRNHNDRSALFLFVCLPHYFCQKYNTRTTGKNAVAQYRQLHEWDTTPREAKQIQERLRERIQLGPLGTEVQTIAGADISFNKYSPTLYAGIVVLSLPDLHVVEEVGVVAETRFPYVPGLLSFREIPPLLRAWEHLHTVPDAIMFDGHGVAHPRRFGLACHAGLLLGIPAFGCAKSILVGTHGELPLQRGNSVPLVDKSETIATVLRTKDTVKPVYVSPGHLIDMETSAALTLACYGGYRQPEPTRHAHHLVNALRRGERAPTL